MNLPEIKGPMVNINPSTPMEAIYRAVTTGADPATIEKLMGLQERFERNLARRAFDKAIASAKADIPPIEKNRLVSFGAGKTSYRFADLAEIDRTVTPILSKYGLSYRFRTDTGTKTGDLIKVTCIVSHEDGYSEENSLSGPADTSGSKNAMQAIGSAVTYLQRYTLNAALGLSASQDNDANNGGSNKLSDDQIDELRTALGADPPRVARFCKIYGLERVEELPANMFATAMRLLGEKKEDAKS